MAAVAVVAAVGVGATTATVTDVTAAIAIASGSGDAMIGTTGLHTVIEAIGIENTTIAHSVVAVAAEEGEAGTTGTAVEHTAIAADRDLPHAVVIETGTEDVSDHVRATDTAGNNNTPHHTTTTPTSPTHSHLSL